MKHSSAQLKKMARTALSGKWKTAAMFTLLNTLLTMGLSLCSMPFENNTTPIGIGIGWLISVIVSLITGLFSAGSAYFYLNICRGCEYSYKDLFYAFKADPDRFLIVTLVTSAPTLLFTLPSLLVPVPSETASLSIWFAYIIAVMGSLYAGIIVSWILSLFFTLSHYLLLDYPEMGAMDALKLSVNMMKGNKGRYIYISLSFFGWLILSVLSMGIALFWIEPYMSATTACFYGDVLNQFNTDPEEAEAFDKEQIIE